MTGLEAVLAALATWRLAYALVYEDGPWGLLARLRKLPYPLGGEEGLLACAFCVSAWMGLLWAALLSWGEPWPDVLLAAVAFSGGAMLLQVSFERIVGEPELI